MTAYLGLGTNMGARLDNLKSAVNALNKVPGVRVTAVADIYETDPVGYENQPCFLNTAVEVETDFDPEGLLGVALGIEAGLGRVRNFKNGPRVIDIDLLFYGDTRCEGPVLTLPHPRIFERGFVLKPLLDLEVKTSLFLKEKALTADFSGVRKIYDKSLLG